jgi:hypothetical protein
LDALDRRLLDQTRAHERCARELVEALRLRVARREALEQRAPDCEDDEEVRKARGGECVVGRGRVRLGGVDVLVDVGLVLLERDRAEPTRRE